MQQFTPDEVKQKLEREETNSNAALTALVGGASLGVFWLFRTLEFFFAHM